MWAWRGYERKTVEYLTKERPDFSRQVLRSAWGQTESKIRFGSGPGWPKLSDGSAAFFDSIFDLEPGHRPKPSNRTEIRFAKPLYSLFDISFCMLCGPCHPQNALCTFKDMHETKWRALVVIATCNVKFQGRKQVRIQSCKAITAHVPSASHNVCPTMYVTGMQVMIIILSA